MNMRCQSKDCHVMPVEIVAKQYRMVVCNVMVETRKRMKVKAEMTIKWWKLRMEECSREFRVKLSDAFWGWSGTTRTVRKVSYVCERHLQEGVRCDFISVER